MLVTFHTNRTYDSFSKTIPKSQVWIISGATDGPNPGTWVLVSFLLRKWLFLNFSLDSRIYLTLGHKLFVHRLAA